MALQNQLDEFVENRFEINKVFQVSDGVVT